MQTALISQTPTFIQRGKKKEKQQKKKEAGFFELPVAGRSLLLPFNRCSAPRDVG